MKRQHRLYIAGAFILLVAALVSKGHHHFDEHFQILEFAALKLHIATPADMPWEYTFKMRPAIQPCITVALYKTFSLFGTVNPFIFATVTRLLSAMLAFVAVALFIDTFVQQIRSAALKQTFVALSFLLWFAVYNEVRFSSENWSGLIFLIGACFYLRKNATAGRIFITGLLLGLAFLFRYQTAFMIAGFLLWLLFIQKEKINRLLLLATAALLVLGIGALTDRWFYGEWTYTIWNYFDQNIIQNKTTQFNIKP